MMAKSSKELNKKTMKTFTKAKLFMALMLLSSLTIYAGCGGEPPKDAATLDQEAAALDREIGDEESQL